MRLDPKIQIRALLKEAYPCNRDRRAWEEKGEIERDNE